MLIEFDGAAPLGGGGDAAVTRVLALAELSAACRGGVVAGPPPARPAYAGAKLAVFRYLRNFPG